MAGLCLPRITTFWFPPKEFILEISALSVERFAYCQIRMGMKFRKGCGLDFLGLIQLKFNILPTPKALEGKDERKSPGPLL